MAEDPTAQANHPAADAAARAGAAARAPLAPAGLVALGAAGRCAARGDRRGPAAAARAADPARGDTQPIEVVKGFAAAIEAKDADRLLALVEPTVYRREISPEVRAYVEYLEEVRFDNPRYELLDNDGERAHVRWTANMVYTLNLGDERKSSGERPIDMTFELAKFEGVWYLHSAKMPN